MASSKATFYSTHLYAALTAGEWASDSPSRTGHRGGLPWPELLRKCRKHCPHLREFTETASHTQALALLLIRARAVGPDALDGDHTSPDEPVALGEECLLPPERRGEAQASYDALQKLPTSDSVRLALASYSYALGRYSDAIAQITSVGIDDASSLNASNVGSLSSALSVPESKTTVSATPSTTALDGDIREGRMWRAIERIRAWCLQGMAHESLSQPSPAVALTSYERALPFMEHISIPKSLPSATGKPSIESFTRYRELWRWVERILWRGSILSAQTRAIPDTLVFLRAYQAQSIHWPATFRPEHRSTVAQLHLRALIETYSPASKTVWLNEARSIVTDYRIVLTATTTFPRAGERNSKVEEFVDLCIAVWEASGGSSEHTGWVIEVLWWATRFTFNSQRIYRHLTRTLCVSGDTTLAQRTLRLYVQITGKARQTGGADAVEADAVWADTLIQGARMLCRMPGGIDEAREAGALLRTAREQLDEHDNVAVAALRRAEGVWHACMALREQEPLTRPAHLADSLAALTEARALHPTPSTHFHLALALARPGPARDLAAAVASASAAVEGDATETRFWHLLGLLLAATEDWAAARGVLELGAEIGDRDAQDSPARANGDAVAPEGPSLLSAGAVHLGPAAALHRTVPDYPPPGAHERFEHALQLRMTQLALIEHVDGPENASSKWVEVFGWVAERKGLGEERRSMSVEPPPSESGAHDAAARSPQLQPSMSLTLSRTLSPQGVGTAGIPINLIPPSPREGPVRRADVLSLDSSEKLDQDLLHEKDGPDRSTGKKVQRLLKARVHKGQEHIHTISRKIGRGSGLKRARSAPDLHAALAAAKPYQASSIHSRQRLSAAYSPPEPPPPPPTSPQPSPQHSARERRLLSNLWLTSAATFRRMAQLDQARGAIQEAEVADADNPAVWVQLGLCCAAQGDAGRAIQAFQKALFISPEHVPAFVHLTQQYLAVPPASPPAAPTRDNIDLAAGLLADLTRGAGWDVPDAWYLLARACGLQGKRARERECLSFALALVEGRGVRDVQSAVGWCL